jgi:hypothetical protein
LSTRDEEGLLSRWSRRRLEVREAEEREAQEIAAREAEQAEAQALLADPEQRDMPPDDETRQKWIEELEQIDIDSLSYDNDFTIFMKSWVPGALRQRALRKLWTTNPTLAVLDGLNDYDLDYTDAAMGAGKVISSWSPQGGYAKLEELTEKVSELAAATKTPAQIIAARRKTICRCSTIPLRLNALPAMMAMANRQVRKWPRQRPKMQSHPARRARGDSI